MVNEFSGLIFDAGAFPAATGMERNLDNALRYGVEKVVLFAQPDAVVESDPQALEEIFPDLVLRGNEPWSKAPGVIWADPMTSDMLDALAQKLSKFKNSKFLLGNVARFDLEHVKNLVRNHHNLWIGFGRDEIERLQATCVQGPLYTLMKAARNRVVFASFGGDEGWKSYKWTIRKLKKLATLMSPAQADAFIYKNAEELYGVPVNAP
ncbi:MAG: hypothetical protein HWE34_17805 [Methylocystaceae bacterium]|nr:hypothetical protein [Methylocystaceae bacterium]